MVLGQFGNECKILYHIQNKGMKHPKNKLLAVRTQNVKPIDFQGKAY